MKYSVLSSVSLYSIRPDQLNPVIHAILMFDSDVSHVPYTLVLCFNSTAD